MTRRIYLWLGLSLAFVIATVIIFVAFFYQARLTVIPTPGDAEVILNGQPIATGVPQNSRLATMISPYGPKTISPKKRVLIFRSAKIIRWQSVFAWYPKFAAWRAMFALP
mgnify:CR=1 FL=1